MFNIQEMWPKSNRFVNKGGKERPVRLSWTQKKGSVAC